MAIVALTTEDNPFDPIDDFDNWYSFDEQNGYHTSSYLARIARTSNDESYADYEAALEQAIDEIVAINTTGNYKKIVKED